MIMIILGIYITSILFYWFGMFTIGLAVKQKLKTGHVIKRTSNSPRDRIQIIIAGLIPVLNVVCGIAFIFSDQVDTKIAEHISEDNP